MPKKEMPHSMPSDIKNTSPEFPPDELLIFIGHSDDASAEANAINALESEIEHDFRLLRKPVGDCAPFCHIRLWKWSDDALATPGGQETVVTPALECARIAIFIFKERIGKVTWQALEKARERSRDQRLHILAFFPEEMPYQGKYPNAQAKLQAARDWTAGGCRSEAVQNVRTWPWPEDEGELSFRLANYGKKIGATTVVGSYPDGTTQEGLHDMLGNVWEWMDNWFDEKKQFHAVRGGSWFNDADALRCSSRDNGYPRYNYYFVVGFRVIRSSPFSS